MRDGAARGRRRAGAGRSPLLRDGDGHRHPVDRCAAGEPARPAQRRQAHAHLRARLRRGRGRHRARRRLPARASARGGGAALGRALLAHAAARRPLDREHHRLAACSATARRRWCSTAALGRRAARASSPRARCSIPDTERVMGWDVVDTGFKVVLSAARCRSWCGERPARRRRRVPARARAAPRRHRALRLPHRRPQGSRRRSRRRFAAARERCSSRGIRCESAGNLSSASVLFVLRDLLERAPRSPATTGCCSRWARASAPSWCCSNGRRVPRPALCVSAPSASRSWCSRGATRALASRAAGGGRAQRTYRFMVAVHALFLRRLRRGGAAVAPARLRPCAAAASRSRWWPRRRCAGGPSRRWARAGTCASSWCPAQAPVTHGPYRFLRHPNYLAVVIEMFGVPLIDGAWLTRAGLLRRQRRCSSGSASAPRSGRSGEQYGARLPRRPRFMPTEVTCSARECAACCAKIRRIASASSQPPGRIRTTRCCERRLAGPRSRWWWPGRPVPRPLSEDDAAGVRTVADLSSPASSSAPRDARVEGPRRGPPQPRRRWRRSALRNGRASHAAGVTFVRLRGARA